MNGVCVCVNTFCKAYMSCDACEGSLSIVEQEKTPRIIREGRS